jgi:hypothetical protein
MSKRGKRPGLRARSKNARSEQKIESQAILRTPPGMFFTPVEQGVPHENALTLVRLRDGTFRFGMVMLGRFAAFDHNSDTFVTMAHPERISHWLVVHDPVARPHPSDEDCHFVEEGATAPKTPDDRPEDVYA